MQRAFCRLEDFIIGQLAPVLKREIREDDDAETPLCLPDVRGPNVAGRSNTAQALPCDAIYRVLDCKTSVKITFYG